MKKRISVFALLLIASIILIVIILPPVNAELVCGQEPDSALGYGQINIWDVIYSCDNNADGVCPEDYQNPDNGVYGNCANCNDPDCTGNVTGKVYDSSSIPISRATVKSLPVRYNTSASSMEKSAITDESGIFSLNDVTTGTYYFSASQEGFDTQLIDVTVTRKNTTSGVTFYLHNGTCYDDCTNSYGRCDAKCDGLTFNNGTTQCTFVNDTIKTACDTRFKGTEVIIPGSFNGTHAKFVDCCEGTPYWKYYQPATVSTSSIKNLAKFEKLAKYNDQPVRIIIAYWPIVD